MVRIATAAIYALIALLNSANAGFMDTADTLSGHLNRVAGHLDRLTNNARSASQRFSGDVKKARSFQEQAQALFCKFPGLSSMKSCQEFKGRQQSFGGSYGGQFGSPSGAPDQYGRPAAASGGSSFDGSLGAAPPPPSQPTPKCSGEGCCMQSSCLSGTLPGLKCSDFRGGTLCVGAKLFPPKEGICECKVGGCSIDGKCPDAPKAPPPSTSSYSSPTPFPSYQAPSFPTFNTIQRFEVGHGEAIPQENFVIQIVAIYVFAGTAAILGLLVAGRALRRRTGTRREPLLLQDEALVE